MRMAWDPRITDEEIVRQAEALVSNAALLDPYQVTYLDTELTKVPGGRGVGKRLVATWIGGFRARRVGEVNDENPFGKLLHADIKAAFDAANQRACAKAGVVEALTEIVKDRGWGPRHELALRSASVQDFETILRTAETEQLRLVLRKMIEFSTRKDQYLQHFAPRWITSSWRAGTFALIRTRRVKVDF